MQFVLADYSWAWSLPWLAMDTFSGTLLENTDFFFSFLAGINYKQLLVWGQTLCLLPLLHAGTFVWFEPVQALSVIHCDSVCVRDS